MERTIITSLTLCINDPICTDFIFITSMGPVTIPILPYRSDASVSDWGVWPGGSVKRGPESCSLRPKGLRRLGTAASPPPNQGYGAL